MSDEVTENKKKKKSPVAIFFLTILYIVLAIIIALGLWLMFSAFDKKSSLAMLPNDYVAYLHTDSLYDSVNPLFDLQAADIYLSKDDMSEIRGIFMMLRESDLRNNTFVKYAATRKVDAAFYAPQETPDTFVAAIDFGVFSAGTRLATIILPKVPVEGISHIQEGGIDFFKYVNGNNTFFFKPVKNLVIVSNSFDYFKKSLTADNDKNYSKSQIELLTKKTKEPIKLIVDAKTLAQSFTKDDPVLYKFTSVISDQSLSLVSFKITDNEININIEIPLNESDDIKNDKNLANILKLFEHNSTEPDIVTVMSSSIQYYTVLNAGSLKELVDAAIPAMPADKNAEGLLKTADDLCHSLFKLSLDDIVYDWTDKEFAVLGIEGLNDPVFAVKISNEAKRKQVFDTLVKSILLTENKSLILNGVRIPRLELPSFLQNLLKLFKVNIPKPYYLVYNNYIYFSQSAESIATIYTTFANGTNISHNQNWKAVSEKANKEAAVSLFYDLERSRPFFINSDSPLSQIIELYTIGRTDISLKDNSILFSLNAVSKRAGSLKNIPGFPMDLNAKTDFSIQTCDIKKPETIFWVENDQTLKAMNVKKTQVYSYELSGKVVIKASAQGTNEKVIALTSDNDFYVFNNKLEIEKGYPVKLKEKTIDTPYLASDKSFIPTESGDLLKIEDKRISSIKLNADDFEDSNIMIFYDGAKGVIYERGFLGKIYVLINGKCINADEPIIVDKIGFGTPSITKVADQYYIAFISQSGEATLWATDGSRIEQKHQFNLDGVFYTNFIACDGFFYTVSEQGEVFKINPYNGNVLSIQIDNVTAKEGIIEIRKANEKNYICVGIDGNRIYAFNEDLELVPGFPIAAHGIPAFADVNGDSYPDCFALTMDGKLNAWNLR